MCRIEPVVVLVHETPQSEQISHERIALRAFDKWLARGSPDDDGSQDWFAACSEIHREM